MSRLNVIALLGLLPDCATEPSSSPVPGPPNASGIDATVIQAAIARDGAKATLWRLFEDQDQWNALFEGVASGDEQWLQIAAQLRPHSDAGASETLDMALQRAVQRAPEAVLRLAGPSTFSVADACDGSGGAFEDPRPVMELLDVVAEGRRRIAAVTVVDLTSKRLECLSYLDAAIACLEGAH